MPETTPDNNTVGAARWSIRVFGSLEIETPDGSIVPVTRKKSGEMLAYLALNQDRGHSRETMIDLIWGDSDVGDARMRLRQELLWIRSIGGTNPAFSELLVVSRNEIQLHSDVQVDAVLFQSHFRQAHQTTDWHQKRDLLATATAFYRSPLLVGLEPTWIVAESARLAQIYMQALLERAEACWHLAEFSVAEDCLNRLIAMEPISEEGHIGLMRLYAAMGQPSRVAWQFQSLERMLKTDLDTTPSTSVKELAESLVNEARHVATKRAVPSGSPDNHAGLATTYTQPTGSQTESTSLPSRSTTRRAPSLAWLVVIIAALAVLLFTLPRHNHRPAMATADAGVSAGQHWAYLYAPGPGEKQNADGKAIVTDEKQNIYVTGLIQTEHDDADILTLKLSPGGEQLWTDRYSSPEHDCDRAFSIARDTADGVFVAGETYVPAHQKDAEGWHFTLLHYDGQGHRLWTARSPMLVHTSEECITVLGGSDGGCTLVGTMLARGTDVPVALRYSREGKLLWNCPVPSKDGAAFAAAFNGQDGRTYLCGTAKVDHKSGDAETNWLTACIDGGGNVVWKRLEAGPTHGAASARKIGVDQSGNSYVMGAFQVRDRPGTTARKLALIKYGANGTKLWERTVNDSGPTVAPAALAMNPNEDILVVGNELRSNGKNDAVLTLFDTYGSQIQCFHYDRIQPNVNAQVTSGLLLENRHIILEAITCEQETPLRYHRAAINTTCNADGSVIASRDFNPVKNYRHLMQLPESMDLSQYTNVTGQTAVNFNTTERYLFVVQY